MKDNHREVRSTLLECAPSTGINKTSTLLISAKSWYIYRLPLGADYYDRSRKNRTTKEQPITRP